MSDKKWFRDRLTALVDNVIAAIVLAGGVAVWAAVRFAAAVSGFGTAAAVAVGVVVFAAGVVAYNQILELADGSRRRRLRRASPKKIEGQLRSWLWARGLPVQRTEVPDSDFAFITKAIDEVPVTVWRPSSRRTVQVSARMDVHKDHQPILRKHAPLFVYDLVQTLYGLGLQTTIAADNHGSVESVSVWTELIFDEYLTEVAFLEATLQVRRGAQLVRAAVHRVVEEQRLREAPGEPAALPPGTQRESTPTPSAHDTAGLDRPEAE